MTRLIALDLSLTATGIFVGDPEDPSAPYELGEITTPGRRINESDVSWNGRRYAVFQMDLMDLFIAHQPQLLVVEITSHAHTSMSRGETKVKTSRGSEFKAGLGLGRAIGWLDGVLLMAETPRVRPARVVTIEAKIAKLRVTGAQSASKSAVAAYLTQIFGWDLTSWKESQIDALAVGLAYLRTETMKAQEAKFQALAEVQCPEGESEMVSAKKCASCGRYHSGKCPKK